MLSYEKAGTSGKRPPFRAAFFLLQATKGLIHRTVAPTLFEVCPGLARGSLVNSGEYLR